MPRLPAYVRAHAGDPKLVNAFLVEIEFPAGTVRWTDWNQRIYALGHAWEPQPIAVHGISSRISEAFTGQIEVGDAAALASSRILPPAAPPADSPARVYEAWLPVDGSTTVAAATVLRLEARVGRVEAPDRGNERKAVLGLRAAVEFRFRPTPRRRFQAKCPDVYKDAACAATGADLSCEKTIAACSGSGKVAPPAAGGNQVRFGGVRDMPPDGWVVTWGDGKFTVRAAEKKTVVAA